MLIKIPDLFTAEQLNAVRSVLQQSEFVDGKLSAGKNAREQKNNQELATDQDSYTALNDVVMTQLVQHPSYLQAAMPARIAAPIYARYSSGMGYGSHLDDAIMGPLQSRYRSDISITIFLSEPDEYQGGELCIENSPGASEIKLPAGHAILYPSTSIHSVNEVTAGERLVAITWVQSHIRRADQREILLQLDQAKQHISDQDSVAYQQLDNCYSNLFRMWAEV
jgi:PKHD-type hydroxylase